MLRVASRGRNRQQRLVVRGRGNGLFAPKTRPSDRRRGLVRCEGLFAAVARPCHPRCGWMASRQKPVTSGFGLVAVELMPVVLMPFTGMTPGPVRPGLFTDRPPLTPLTLVGTPLIGIPPLMNNGLPRAPVPVSAL